MIENDKTIRVFSITALQYGIIGIGYALFIHGLGSWLTGSYFTPLPRRVESVLSIAPWMLVGGLLGLLEHFYRNKKRQLQFGIRLLLLITLLFSLVGAWGTLARSRCQAEQRAVATLNEKFGFVGTMKVGWFFPKTTWMNFRAKPIDADTIPFLVTQLRILPGLDKVTFYAKVISDDDLARLRDEFPQVAIVRD